MFGNSAPVRSRQAEVSPLLPARWSRQRRRAWGYVPGPAARMAFERLRPWLEAAAGDWQLDAGCGTGASTRALAQRQPCRLTVGLDKSLKRLRAGGADAEGWLCGPGWLLQRQDLRAFWWLLAESGLRARRQYLLYPNPWPKPGQVRRRWQAQPVLPLLLRAAHALELRSNWKVYVDEFALALDRFAITAVVEPLREQQPLSPFERKYQASGHRLWRLRAESIPEVPLA